MAISNLGINAHLDDGYLRTSYSPSNYTDGLMENGTVTYESGHVESVLVFVLDARYGQHENTIGPVRIEKGKTTSLKTLFPNQDLIGKYLYSENARNNETVPIVKAYGKVSDPFDLMLSENLSREAVDLTWTAGSAGTNNSVTGYDVEYQDSADGVTWPSSWTTASGSPVTATKLSVSPPSTVGYYRRFRVRTRGSAGSDYYSAWVISTNTLRRKWNAFGAYTDPTLSVGGDLRAVHMTELQERVKTIRSFYGMSAPAFTTITGEVTLAADWADHIAEIRTAIDQITTNHAAWITAGAGEPAVAVMEQLREIINNM